MMVIGVDDIPASQATTPSLTSVTGALPELGEALAASVQEPQCRDPDNTRGSTPHRRTAGHGTRIDESSSAKSGDPAHSIVTFALT